MVTKERIERYKDIHKEQKELERLFYKRLEEIKDVIVKCFGFEAQDFGLSCSIYNGDDHEGFFSRIVNDQANLNAEIYYKPLPLKYKPILKTLDYDYNAHIPVAFLSMTDKDIKTIVKQHIEDKEKKELEAYVGTLDDKKKAFLKGML